MRLLAKPIPILVFLLVGIPLSLIVGLNCYLQTDDVRGQIRNAISQTVGIPVSFESIHALPWRGIIVGGISAGRQGEYFHMIGTSAAIQPDYLAFLHGDVSVRKISLTRPVMEFSQSRTAGVIAPSPIIPSTAVIAKPSFGTSCRASEESTTGAGNIILHGIPSLNISEATVTLLNENNLPIALLQNITLTGKYHSSTGWKGSIEIEKATVGSSLIVHEIQSPVTLSSDDSSISLDDITAVLGGGKLSGRFSISLPPAAPHYHANLHLAEASLNQFLLDASFGDVGAGGGIAGDLQITGSAGLGSSMEGNGTLLCTNAVIQPADFLRQIGQILQIEELQTLRLSEGKAVFAIQRGRVLIENLSLRSDNLILTAQGPVLFGGDLDLQARLLFNEKLTSRIRGFLGPQLARAPEQGYSQVAFHVSGPLNNPKTDLLERLTGIRINGNLGGLLQGLFGRPAPPSSTPH